MDNPDASPKLLIARPRNRTVPTRNNEPLANLGGTGEFYPAGCGPIYRHRFSECWQISAGRDPCYAEHNHIRARAIVGLHDRRPQCTDPAGRGRRNRRGVIRCVTDPVPEKAILGIAARVDHECGRLYRCRNQT